MTFVDSISRSPLYHSLTRPYNFAVGCRAELMGKLPFHWIQSAIFLIMSAHNEYKILISYFHQTEYSMVCIALELLNL